MKSACVDVKGYKRSVLEWLNELNLPIRYVRILCNGKLTKQKVLPVFNHESDSIHSLFGVHSKEQVNILYTNFPFPVVHIAPECNIEEHFSFAEYWENGQFKGYCFVNDWFGGD